MVVHVHVVGGARAQARISRRRRMQSHTGIRPARQPRPDGVARTRGLCGVRLVRGKARGLLRHIDGAD